MPYRYKLIDTKDRSIAGRFSSLQRALDELAVSVPPKRFILIDRETGKEITG